VSNPREVTGLTALEQGLLSILAIILHIQDNEDIDVSLFQWPDHGAAAV
jgi:hypothetical protein